MSQQTKIPEPVGRWGKRVYKLLDAIDWEFKPEIEKEFGYCWLTIRKVLTGGTIEGMVDFVRTIIRLETRYESDLRRKKSQYDFEAGKITRDERRAELQLWIDSKNREIRPLDIVALGMVGPQIREGEQPQIRVYSLAPPRVKRRGRVARSKKDGDRRPQDTPGGPDRVA